MKRPSVISKFNCFSYYIPWKRIRMSYSKFIIFYLLCALLINCCICLVIKSKLQQPRVFPNGYSNTQPQLLTNVNELEMELSKPHSTFTLSLSGVVTEPFNVTFTLDHGGVVECIAPITFNQGVSENIINITGLRPGQVTITCSCTDQEINTNKAYVVVTNVHTFTLDVVSDVVGWIYFIAWSISFYPQIFINWKRKSVVGLNFDFVFLNITGFFLYSLYNCGLFWSPAVQSEYFARFPRSVIPVQINDVVFSLHALFATIVTVIQCYLYERGSQSVSIAAKLILLLIGLTSITTIILASCKVTTWYEFLNICSYIKLCITLIKYIPQAFMNFRRKSTGGWSIGNVLLDFTGGAFSMLQMFILAYNNDDWSQLFGDFTKFALGLISILFDIIFMIQHYILYRHADPSDKKILEESNDTESSGIDNPSLINPDYKSLSSS